MRWLEAQAKHSEARARLCEAFRAILEAVDMQQATMAEERQQLHQKHQEANDMVAKLLEALGTAHAIQRQASDGGRSSNQLPPAIMKAAPSSLAQMRPPALPHPSPAPSTSAPQASWSAYSPGPNDLAHMPWSAARGEDRSWEEENKEAQGVKAKAMPPTLERWVPQAPAATPTEPLQGAQASAWETSEEQGAQAGSTGGTGLQGDAEARLEKRVKAPPPLNSNALAEAAQPPTSHPPKEHVPVRSHPANPVAMSPKAGHYSDSRSPPAAEVKAPPSKHYGGPPPAQSQPSVAAPPCPPTSAKKAPPPVPPGSQGSEDTRRQGSC